MMNALSVSLQIKMGKAVMRTNNEKKNRIHGFCSNLVQRAIIWIDDVSHYKDGSWKRGLFAHRENCFLQPIYSIQVRPWDLPVKP